MITESKLQSEIVKFLRHKGCYVIKTRPGLGVPAGCPDILFFIEGFYGAIECKSNPKAPYQPLQKETLEQLDEWSWAKMVEPENWAEIKQELEVML